MVKSKENVSVLVKTICVGLNNLTEIVFFFCASNNINLTYSHHVLSKSWRDSHSEGQHIGMQKLEFLTESSVPLGISVF